MFYASVITRIIHITFLIFLNLMSYSADLDLSIPHIGTQERIRSLNFTLDDSWRAWFVDAQVAGLVSGLPILQFYAVYIFIFFFSILSCLNYAYKTQTCN